jgi:hypothetical protein
MAARSSQNVQDKSVIFTEDRLYSDLQHWADPTCMGHDLNVEQAPNVKQ